MFSNLTKAGKLSLRLPEDVRVAFLAKYKTTLSEEYGIVRKEYVVVPDTLLANAWVKAMKPKPMTKKKTSGR